MSMTGIYVGGQVDPETQRVTVRMRIGTGEHQTVFLEPHGAHQLGLMLVTWACFAAGVNQHIEAGDEIGALALMDQEGTA